MSATTDIKTVRFCGVHTRSTTAQPESDADADSSDADMDADAAPLALLGRRADMDADAAPLALLGRRAGRSDADAAPLALPRRRAGRSDEDEDSSDADMDADARMFPRPALVPFRGQMRLVPRPSHVFDVSSGSLVLCCVNPATGTFVVFDDKFFPLATVLLSDVTASILVAGSVDVLYVEVDSRGAAPDLVFVLVPPSRAAAGEWAVMLARCGVPVHGHAFAASSANLSGRCMQRSRGEQQPRNALNGARPLVYWVR